MMFAWKDTGAFEANEARKLNELSTYVTSRICSVDRGDYEHDEFTIKFRGVRDAMVTSFVTELRDVVLPLLHDYYIHLYYGDNEVSVTKETNFKHVHITKLVIHMTKK